MYQTDDTIAAIATAAGRGGIGIIRLSGNRVPELAEQLLGSLPRARQAEFHTLRDASGDAIDQAVVLYYPAPHSFTGEHVLELQGHGGPVVLDLLLSRVLELGARQARPGEFSERAFLNDKLDLAQAEAIADLIDSSTSASARAAVQSISQMRISTSSPTHISAHNWTRSKQASASCPIRPDRAACYAKA